MTGGSVAIGLAIAQVVHEGQKEFQGIDMLINNTCTGSEETIMEASNEKWQYFWDLHVMAAIRLSRELVPLLQVQGGGVIINNASFCATQPSGYEPIYNTTKAALVQFWKCLANELIKENIPIPEKIFECMEWIKKARKK